MAEKKRAPAASIAACCGEKGRVTVQCQPVITVTDLTEAMYDTESWTSGATRIDYAPMESGTNSESVTRKGFLDALYRGDFIYVTKVWVRSEPAEPHSLESLSELMSSFTLIRHVCDESRPWLFDALVEGRNWWVRLDVGTGYVAAEFGTQTHDEGLWMAGQLRKGLEKRHVPRTTTNVLVYAKDDQSIRCFDDVTWSSVSQNYASATREQLDQLMGIDSSSIASSAGRLVLFHGPPGTGKTWAIRSLLTTWKSWTEGVVVLDAEELLANGAYLMQMVRQGAKSTTRVIILEDIDELVLANEDRGAGLSRLLNVADGIVGAAHDVLVLLTTNAPPDRLDRALLRPGRCLASVEFTPFSAEEARLRGADSTGTGQLTLAEVFEKIGDTRKIGGFQSSPLTGQYL